VVEDVLREPAAGTESTSVEPPPPTSGADLTVVEATESSSLQPVTPINEAAPATIPPPAAPQEHDALGSAVRATSPEIQETGEGSGVAQPPDPEDGDVRILNLAHFSWETAFEVGDDAEED
jgi:hypothetical protein